MPKMELLGALVAEKLTKEKWKAKCKTIWMKYEKKTYQEREIEEYCFHFSFVNFSASKGPRNSILDIFQQPFQCRF